MASRSAYWATPDKIHQLAGRPEVAFDRAPIAGAADRVLLANRGHLHAAEALVGEVMDHAHETEPDDADLEHFPPFASSMLMFLRASELFSLKPALACWLEKLIALLAVTRSRRQPPLRIVPVDKTRAVWLGGVFYQAGETGILRPEQARCNGSRRTRQLPDSWWRRAARQLTAARAASSRRGRGPRGKTQLAQVLRLKFLDFQVNRHQSV